MRVESLALLKSGFSSFELFKRETCEAVEWFLIHDYKINWYFERNYLPLSQISFSICRVDPNCRIGIGEGFSKFPKLHTQNQFGCRSSLYLVEAGGTLEEVFLCGFAGTVQDNGLVKSSQGSVIVLIYEKTASLLELRLCLHCLLFVA